ncbi:hypothetical protein [Paenibacillus sp. N3/727]|uniref:hypothetical protein n=1 Tax=Paenibacillus sp. N3/727 TaxID=2925845 RepID=UPI0032205274
MLFLDTSQNMINQVKQKISDFNIQNVDTLCFDFEKEGLLVIISNLSVFPIINSPICSSSFILAPEDVIMSSANLANIHAT